MTDPDTSRTARELAELAARLHSATTLARVVGTFLGYAVPLVGADMAGVTLLNRRTVEIAGTTCDTAECADRLQLETGEGPPWTPRTTRPARHGVAVHGIAAAGRWPQWCEQISAELGIRSVLSVQLCLPRRTVGALNLYIGEKYRFSDDDLSVGRLLGQHAAIAFTNRRHELDLRHALDSRRVIGTAIGMLMEPYNSPRRRRSPYCAASPKQTTASSATSPRTSSSPASCRPPDGRAAGHR